MLFTAQKTTCKQFGDKVYFCRNDSVVQTFKVNSDMSLCVGATV